MLEASELTNLCSEYEILIAVEGTCSGGQIRCTGIQQVSPCAPWASLVMRLGQRFESARRLSPVGLDKLPGSRLRRVVSQEGGIGVARLKDSPSSENKIVAECEDCARLSTLAGQSSIASSIAAVLTTRCRES